MLNKILLIIARFLLRLRYKVDLQGVEAISAKGKSGILFLPNHPGMIDPAIVLSRLYGPFKVRMLAKETEIDLPVLSQICSSFQVIRMPDIHKSGLDAAKAAEKTVNLVAEALKSGENVVLYPAGRIYRSRYENLGSNSAVEKLREAVPGIRIVQVRTRGLWGSVFGFAQGVEPDLVHLFKKSLKCLLSNLIFFAPRRKVTLELHEASDLPKDKMAMNRALEEYYNEDAPGNTRVAYTFWHKPQVEVLPEPNFGEVANHSADHVPANVRKKVVAYLQEEMGVSDVQDEHDLNNDIGMDSLSRIDLGIWLEQEFSCPVDNADALKTVADVLLAAIGEYVSTAGKELKEVDPLWLQELPHKRIGNFKALTLQEAYIDQAISKKNRPIIADQKSGVKTYRETLIGVALLKKKISAIEGRYIGIMLPASVPSTLLYFACLAAGKVPVLLNWTQGERNLKHAVDHTGSKAVITARALVDKVAKEGRDLSVIEDKFVYLEDIGKSATLFDKVQALLTAKFFPSSLRGEGDPQGTAAVLFTSGSESLPKAVPLSHENIITNINDACESIRFYEDDRLLGFLPPFHSFGLATNIALPLCGGMPVAYHANPTEGLALGRMVKSYACTVNFGTPTFLQGIIRTSSKDKLETLRVAFSGAEKCPDKLMDQIQEKCPQMILLEGYGITECSPVVSVNDCSDPQPGTIGKVLNSIDYAVVDAESLDKRVEVGEAGMLLVRGKSIMKDYLHYDGASPFIDFEGHSWYKTGDLVAESKTGVLTFRGRLKRFIKLGGEMVSLPAIEAALAPSVATEDDTGPSLAIETYNLDDDKCEVVLVQNGAHFSREEANKALKEIGLSPLHNIRHILEVDAIPVLGTGKTDYRTLHTIVQEKIAAMHR